MALACWMLALGDATHNNTHNTTGPTVGSVIDTVSPTTRDNSTVTPPRAFLLEEAGPHTQNALAVAAAAGVLASAPTMVAVGRTAMQLQVGCMADDELDMAGLSRALHPVGLRLGEPPLDWYAGAVAYNIAALCGVALLASIPVWVLSKLPQQTIPQAQARLRLPSFVVPLLFGLHQALAFSAFRLLLRRGKWWQNIAGGLSLVVCIAAPVFLLRTVLRKSAFAAYRYPDPYLPVNPSRRQCLHKIMYGTERWRSVGASGFVQRFGGLFEGLNWDAKSWMIGELLFGIALAAVCAGPVNSVVRCWIRSGFVVALLLAHCFATWKWLPGASPFHNLFNRVHSTLVLLASIVDLISVSPSVADIAWPPGPWILFCSSVVLTAKAVIEVLLRVGRVAMERRTVQEEHEVIESSPPRALLRRSLKLERSVLGGIYGPGITISESILLDAETASPGQSVSPLRSDRELAIPRRSPTPPLPSRYDKRPSLPGIKPVSSHLDFGRNSTAPDRSSNSSISAAPPSSGLPLPVTPVLGRERVRSSLLRPLRQKSQPGGLAVSPSPSPGHAHQHLPPRRRLIAERREEERESHSLLASGGRRQEERESTSTSGKAYQVDTSSLSNIDL
eukprot:Hpha_TRINITY_DN11745_c0_g1::TRINITY_DN11745_c0_g1_i1::g.31980::m.31980